MRIITGSARGARLLAPKGMTTRPTADRVKESVFNILGDKVRDRRVLDLFAGSGALGLESLSRGASHALMVDRDSVGIIAKNAAHTHLEHKAKILDMDVMAALSRLEKEEKCFGIIFSDPPYHRDGQRLYWHVLQGVICLRKTVSSFWNMVQTKRAFHLRH